MNYRWLARTFGIGVARLSVTFVAVVFISFVLVRLSPYSPVPLALGGAGATAVGLQAQINYLYGLYPTGPLYLQFLNYLWSILNGNFGHSIPTGQAVAVIIVDSLPWTLLIVVSSILISFGIGTVLGIIVAYKRASKTDTFWTMVSTVTYSLPVYVVSIVLLIAFAFAWRVFPQSGAYNVNDTVGVNYPFISSVLGHAILPVLSLTIVSFGAWALNMRANTVGVLGEDYVWTAEARGISSLRVALSYVGRNAILPQFTNLVLALGFAFAGSVFVEVIFTYPGVGYQLITAIQYNDFPVIMGIFIAYILSVLIGLIIADLTYGFLDPRARE